MISLSRQESVIFRPVRKVFSPKVPLLGRPEGYLTSPCGRQYNSGMGQGARFVAQSENSASTEKTKSYHLLKKSLITAVAMASFLIIGALSRQAQAPSPADHAADDGLALTPPMGWYPWNIFGQEPQNEKLIREIVDALVASGMKDAGYSYVGPDEGICFYRGTDGKLTTNLERYPSGLRGLGRRYPPQGPEVRPLHGRRHPHLQQGHAGHQGPRIRGHAALRRLARGLHQDRLVQHAKARTSSRPTPRSTTPSAPPAVPSSTASVPGATAIPGSGPRAIGHLWRTTSDICAPGKADWAHGHEDARGANEKLYPWAGPGPLERPRHADRRDAGPERGPEPGLLQPLVHDGRAAHGRERPARHVGIDHPHPDQPRGHRHQPGPARRPGAASSARPGRSASGPGSLSSTAARPSSSSIRAGYRGRGHRTSELGIAPTAAVRVRDLWAHATQGPAISPEGVLSVQVDPAMSGSSGSRDRRTSPCPPLSLPTLISSPFGQPARPRRSSPGRSR